MSSERSVAKSRCTAVHRQTRTDLRVTPACPMDTPVLRHLPRPCPGTRTTAPASTPYLKMTSISYFLLLPSSPENSAEFHFYVKVQQLTPKPQANRIVDCFSQSWNIPTFTLPVVLPLSLGCRPTVSRRNRVTHPRPTTIEEW